MINCNFKTCIQKKVFFFGITKLLADWLPIKQRVNRMQKEQIKLAPKSNFCSFHIYTTTWNYHLWFILQNQSTIYFSLVKFIKSNSFFFQWRQRKIDTRQRQTCFINMLIVIHNSFGVLGLYLRFLKSGFLFVRRTFPVIIKPE